MLSQGFFRFSHGISGKFDGLHAVDDAVQNRVGKSWFSDNSCHALTRIWQAKKERIDQTVLPENRYLTTQQEFEIWRELMSKMPRKRLGFLMQNQVFSKSGAARHILSRVNNNW